MRKAIAIAANELVVQRAYLGAAAVIAGLTLAAPLAPGLTQWSAQDIREVVTSSLGFGYCVIAAVLLGGTFIGRELGQGRFGFYLARPVSGTSIWLGKLLGAYLTVLCCEVLVSAPAILLHSELRAPGVGATAVPGPSEPFDLAALNWAALALLGAPLVLLLLAHAGALIWRARTAWIALDLAAPVVSGLVFWQAFRVLAPLVDSDAVLLLAVGYAAPLPVLLLIGGWVATVVGRADLRRAHAALSVGLWPLVLVAALGAAAFSRWELDVTPHDLRGVREVYAAPAGEWLVVGGHTTRPLSTNAGFLYRIGTGEFIRLPAEGAFSRYWFSPAVSLSPDGGAAAWLDPVDEDRSQVIVADLAASPPQISRTTLFTSGRADLAISEAGDRIAIMDEPTLAVYDVQRGRLLASRPIPAGYYLYTPVFETRNTVAVYVLDRWWRDEESQRPLEEGVYELDVEDGTFSQVGPFEGSVWLYQLQIDRQRSRALVPTKTDEDSPWVWSLIEWPTHRAVCQMGERESSPEMRMLSDGRIAYVREVDGHIELTITDTEGRPTAVFDLGRGTRAVIGGEPEPGFLAVGLVSGIGPFKALAADTSMRLVDLETGHVREIGRRLLPRSVWGALPPLSSVAAPGSAITRCFRGRWGELVVWDPATDELVTVVGPGPEVFGTWRTQWWPF